jgi:hypothetical protein
MGGGGGSVADPYPHGFGLLDPHFKCGSGLSNVKICAEILITITIINM